MTQTFGPAKPQACSWNWHRAKTARAAAIASSLHLGRSTMVGWNPRLLITPSVPPRATGSLGQNHAGSSACRTVAG
jgi:hypothetical protein